MAAMPARPGRIAVHPFDRAALLWMRTTSRPVPRVQTPWLIGPMAGTEVVGGGWVEREAIRIGGSLSTGPDHGLLPSFFALAGERFDPSRVDPRIADFYEHTTRWRLDLWSEWSAVAWPFGWVTAAMWGQRLQQLTLPMRPLDVSYGMDSTVTHIHGPDGSVVAAAWVRTMRKTGSMTYSGMYGTATLPGSAQPSVRVVFPLPEGSLMVFLEPRSDSAGGLHLLSRHGAFGSDGAYLVLEAGGDRLRARRIPVAEHFHLYVDSDGDLRTDHDVRLWSIPAVRLHYRMRREA
jgi:hypothetical protein